MFRCKVETTYNQNISFQSYSFLRRDRLTVRSIKLRQIQSVEKAKTPKYKLTPLKKTLSSEVKDALTYLKTHKRAKIADSKEKRLNFFTLNIMKPSDSVEENEYKTFIRAIFSTDPSPYRKNTFISQEDYIDARSAEKLLQTANKIIKHGIKKKDIEGFKGDLEDFWYTNISEKNVVRWDIFEDSFLSCIEGYMVTDIGFIRKTNWLVLIHKLYKDIGDYDDEFYLWPKTPTFTNVPSYPEKIVNIKDFINMISRGDLVHIMKSSQQDHPFYIQSLWKQDKYTYADGSVYEGAWKAGRREGYGRLVLESGEEYRGNFTKGSRHDFGVLTGNSFSYKGEWKNDQFNGYGELVFPDSSVYKGLWRKGQMVNGHYQWSGGSYKGEMHNSAFEGSGILAYNDGEVHKGYWKQGQLFGDAEIIKPDGSLYKGICANGELEGKGYIRTKEFEFKGSLKNSKPHGKGKITYSNRTTYKGEFAEGLLHGFGVFKNLETVYEGEYFHGKQTGSAKIKWKDGTEYHGCVVEGKLTGQGTYFYTPEHHYVKYSGALVSGKFHGKGRLELKSGDFYEGEWKDEKFNGFGELKKGNANYIGSFAAGIFHGFGKLTSGVACYNGQWERGLPEGHASAMDWDGGKYKGPFSDGKPVNRSRLSSDFIKYLKKIAFE